MLNLMLIKKIGLVTCLIGIFSTLSGQVPESDSLALVALYNSANGDSWTDHTNWLEPGQTVSSWYGIVVQNNKVVNILLGNNNLTGTIPPEIGDLINLTTLELKSNHLSGAIPASIGNLTKLRVLSVRSNELIGNIPNEVENLVNLEHLYLFENQLEGEIPEGIGNLVKLEYLLLQRNQLTGPIPEGLWNLTELDHLSLNYNELSDSIPEDIGNLTKMVFLALDQNNLTGSIPGGIGNMTGLTNLNLGYNQFTGSIPEEIGNLTGLTWFSAENNQLKGSIPQRIGDLSELTFLSLRNNELTGPVPAEIGNLTKLNYLILYNNHLDGTIPSEIGNLKELKNLFLYNNELSGAIPEEIASMDSLQILSLEGNELTGTIPAGIGNLKKLREIDLHGNQINGNIPDEVGNLSTLETLDLNNNNLQGRIPDGIRNLTSLNFLKLNYNYFNFYDLEPLTDLSLGTFVYFPQGSVALDVTQLNSITGNDLEIDITELTQNECVAAHNQYQWWKDGLYITTYSDSPVLSLEGLEEEDAGQYQCTIINSDFPELLLGTDTFFLVLDGPVNIMLSPDDVDENVAAGTLVGSLSAEDPDQSSGHSFTLVAGDGINDADNDLFSIRGDSLFIDISPDFETQEEYSVYIQARDDDTKTIRKAFVIHVNDVEESEPDWQILKRKKKDRVKVYPNPVGSQFSLEFTLTVEENLSVELFDLQGNCLQSCISNSLFPAGSYQLTLDVNKAIMPGIYLLMITSSKGVVSIPLRKE